MDTQLQDRYFRLRRELSNLNYVGNFGVDSLELVEQLYRDLVATTESYSHLQDKENHLSQQLSLAQTQLFPLRKENAKLQHENQALHAEIVSLKEESGDRRDALEQQIRKLNEELEDVKYLCQTKDTEIIKIEKERLRLKEAYESVASSSLLSGGVKMKRSMKSSGPPAAAVSSLGNTPHEEAGMLEGNVIETLRTQVEHLQATLTSTKHELESTKESLHRKDQELLKLSTSKFSFTGGVPAKVENADEVEFLVGANRANQRIIDQLNTKVDFLNEQLALRELQLSEKERQLMYLKELQGEYEYRGHLLEKEKESNKQLVSQLITLESRILQFNQATDPSTPLNSPYSTPIAKRDQPYTPLTDHEHDEEEEKESKTTLTDRQVKQSLEHSASLVNELSREENVLRARLKKMEAERADLYNQIEKLTNDLLTQGQMLQDTRLVLDNCFSENTSLRERIEKYSESEKEEIEKSEHDRSRIRSLESQLTVSESSRQRAETALSDLKRDAFDLKKLVNEKSEQLERTLQQQSRTTKEVEYLQKQLRETQQQMLSLQNDLSVVSDEKENLLTSYHALKIENDASQQHLQREMEQQSWKMEQLELELKEKARLDNLRRDNPRGPVDDRGKDKKIRELELQVKRFEVETQNLSNTISSLQFTNQALNEHMKKYSEEKENLEQEVYAEREKNEEYDVEIRRIKAENNRLLLQYETLVEQNKSAQRHTSSVLEQVSENKSVVNDLKNELKLCQKRLDTVIKERDTFQDNLDQLEHQQQQLNLDYAEISRQYALSRQLCDSNEGELEDMRQQIIRCKSQLDEKDILLNKRGLELKDKEKLVEEFKKKYQDASEVIRSMERNEKGSSHHTSRLEREISELKANLEIAKTEIEDYKIQIVGKDNKIQDLYSSLSDLDKEYDTLQHTYDAMLQKHQEDKISYQNVSNQYHDMKHNVDQREKQLMRLTTEYKELKRRLEMSEERYQSLLQDKNELKRRLEMKHNEVGAASEDLQLMTRENQSITNELASVSIERDKLRNRVIELTERCSGLEQSVRALEMERSDLLDTYRTCLQEKRRLESDLNAMSGTKSKLAQTIHELRNEISDLQNDVNSQRAGENRHLAERSALLLQIETLNSQLIEATKKASDWETDANKQAQDNYGLKQTIATLQQRSVTLVSRAAAAADSNKILQARITALERERDSVRVLLDAERKRTSDLAQVVMISRAQDTRQSPSHSPTLVQKASDDYSERVNSDRGSHRQFLGESPDLSSITSHRSSHVIQDRPQEFLKNSKTEELLGISSDEGDDVDEE